MVYWYGKEYNRILIGSNTHIIQVPISRKDSNSQKLNLIGHGNNIPCVSYHSYNEDKIASVSIDGTCCIWDINDRYNIKKKHIDFNNKFNGNGNGNVNEHRCLHLNENVKSVVNGRRNNSNKEKFEFIVGISCSNENGKKGVL